MVVEAKAPQVPRQGNMTKTGDRPHHQRPRSRPRKPASSAPVEGLQRVGQPDGQGEVVIHDVEPGGHRRAHQGHRLHLPAAEAKATAPGPPASASQNAERPEADAAYEFINWFLDGWAGAYPEPPGLLQRRAGDRQGKMEPLRGAYWMEGKPASRTSRAPTATCWPRGDHPCDGGSHEQRMGGIACWNAVMDENATWSEVERVRSGLTALAPS